MSVLDEQGTVVLDSLVLPEQPIRDYKTEYEMFFVPMSLSRYSGITAAMMQGVTTRLSDIQRRLQVLPGFAHLMSQEVLPSNAILVGHSLENDLNALKVVPSRCIRSDRLAMPSQRD